MQPQAPTFQAQDLPSKTYLQRGPGNAYQSSAEEQANIHEKRAPEGIPVSIPSQGRGWELTLGDTALHLESTTHPSHVLRYSTNTTSHPGSKIRADIIQSPG